MTELFGLGRAWAGAFRKEVDTTAPRLVADAPISASALKLNHAGGGPAPESTRDKLQAASTSLRDAFGAFARETSAVYATSTSTRSASGLLTGWTPRASAVDVDFATLETTSAINSRVATSRSSSAAIGLDVTTAEAASTRVSTGEMNTGFTTSYGSSSLTFANGGNTSSSTGSLTGTYTGTGAAANATSLMVQITSGDTIGAVPIVGAGDISFDVKDQTGTVLFTYSGTLDAGEQVYLGADIGLSLSFSAGQLKNNTSATTTVTKTPTTVSTTAAFNAGAAVRPQFDGGAVVTAGSFSVNGTSIAVNADDSIDSVLARINSSGAGVTATASGDTITLTSNGNSEDVITLADDTSGFLAATKLSAAATTLGNVRDDLQLLTKTSQFSSVSSGSFSVNGVSISVDKDADSLSSIVSRVNSSGAGVTASYDSGTDTLTFTSNVAGAALTIDSDTSGFLAAANVATGTVRVDFDADAAFDATGAGAAMFEDGLAVTAGTFTVNDETITVAADDTVNSVLAKITGSAAGVTASYDAATETIALVSTDGNTGPIVLGGDTSGFLAAVKLDGSAQAGTDTVTYSAFEAELRYITEYGGVSAGVFTVNGEDAAIDPDTMTVDDVVAALDGLTGVSASLNEVNGGIDIWADDGGTVTVSDTSGLLAQLGLSAGSTTPRTSEESLTTVTGTRTTNNAVDVAADVTAAAKTLTEALAELGESADGRQAVDRAIDRLRAAGVRGLSASGEGTELEVSVSTDELVNSLNALTESSGLATAVERALEGLTEDITYAAGWNAGPSTVQKDVTLVHTADAQWRADQTATTLLLMKSALRPQDSQDYTQQQALKAYSDGT